MSLYWKYSVFIFFLLLFYFGERERWSSSAPVVSKWKRKNLSFFSATNVHNGIWRKFGWTVGLKSLKRSLIKPKVETFTGNGTDDIFFSCTL